MAEAKKAKGANDYSRFGKIDLSDEEEEAAPPAAAPGAPKPLPATKPASPAKPPSPKPPAPPPSAAPEPTADDGAPAKPAGGYRYWAKPSAPRVIPQKIDPALVAAAEVKSVGSVWNAAGTYEEKDQTEWAKKCLADLLASASLELEGGGSARCTGVKVVQGDVGVHVVRGKKRYLFDLKLDVPFEVELPGSEKLFSGEIEVTDFSSHNQQEWEVGCARARPCSAVRAWIALLPCSGMSQG